MGHTFTESGKQKTAYHGKQRPERRDLIDKKMGVSPRQKQIKNYQREKQHIKERLENPRSVSKILDDTYHNLYQSLKSALFLIPGRYLNLH
jgi:ribosomal protein L19E